MTSYIDNSSRTRPKPAPGIKISQMRLKIHMHPIQPLRRSNFHHPPHHLCCNPASLKIGMNAGVQNKPMHPAIPCQIDKTDQNLAVISANMAETMRQNRREITLTRRSPRRHKQAIQSRITGKTINIDLYRQNTPRSRTWSSSKFKLAKSGKYTQKHAKTILTHRLDQQTK